MLILRVQVFKLLQEAQVIQLYVWMRKKRKNKNHSRNVLSLKIPNQGLVCSKRGHRRPWGSPEDDLTELEEIREGFWKEALPQLSLMLKIKITIIITSMY